MSDINLKSAIYRIVRLKKKTRAKVFKAMREGDLIQFSMAIKNLTGASGGGNYASYVKVENLTQGTSVSKSQSELTNLLPNIFEIEKEDE